MAGVRGHHQRARLAEHVEQRLDHALRAARHPTQVRQRCVDDHGRAAAQAEPPQVGGQARRSDRRSAGNVVRREQPLLRHQASIRRNRTPQTSTWLSDT